MEQALKAITNYTHDRYFVFPAELRRYINILALLLTYFFAQYFLGKEAAFTQGLWAAFVVYWLVTLGQDSISFYNWIYKSPVGKLSLFLLASIGAVLTTTLTSLMINSITGIDPSEFPQTLAMFSIFNIPLLLIISLALLYIALLPLLLILTTFWMMTSEPQGKESKIISIVFPGYRIKEDTTPHQRKTRIFQILSLFTLSVVAFNSLQSYTSNYSNFITDQVRAFLFNMEMYDKAPCQLEANTRVAFLDEDKVLIGTKGKDTITFKIGTCSAE